jgi:alkylation response protein AidB-like acyl-CoA dehydrogenase
VSFLPTSEQQAMAEAVRDALDNECSPAALREEPGGDQRRRVWASLAGLGMFALTIPDRFGGLDLDQTDAIGVLLETGRAAVPGPIAETFAVTHALQTAGADAVAALWLPRIATGEAIVTLGLGRSPLVESADRADLILLQHDEELHAVPASAVRIEHQQSIDSHRRLFSVAWTPSAATVLVDGPKTDAAITTARHHLLLATSAQLLGLAKRLLDLSVRHVIAREQFGHPLGTFQAVQHRLADVAVAVEFAGPVVARAACALLEGAPSASRDVAMAKIFASEAAERAAYAGLQVHGAIGYTREHDLHLYALRAWSLAVAHGDARAHRQHVAAELLSAEPAPRFPND